LFAEATLVTDTPDKLRVPVTEGERVLAEVLVQELAAAQREVVILTPYFVPEDWGARLFTGLAERGVQVRIVTNSLAANNHAYVHGGYMRHRKALLAAGVELYEVRADAPQLLGDVPGDSGASLTMHTKLAVIDDVTVVGSLNFDPRSIKLNSEVGLFIDNADIARKLVNAIDEDIRKYAFRLSLDAQGDLVWTWEYDGRTQVYRQEPGATVWQKTQAAIAAVLPVEGQL
jgi:putative cardiolipin synthase